MTQVGVFMTWRLENESAPHLQVQQIQNLLKTYAVSESKTTKIQYSTEEKRLHQLYKIVKIQRIEKTVDIDLISKIFSETLTTYPSEWLLFLELYELVHLKDISLKNKIFEHLIKLKQNTHFSKLIADGLELIIKN